MKTLYIWGAGVIGKRLLHHLSDEWSITFVDSNKKLANSFCCGKKVISVEKYLEKHSDEFILIAHLYERESIDILRENNIINYFIHCDYPGEFHEPYARDNLKNYIIRYLGNRNDFVLYGLNLYSIIIDEWLVQQYGIHPYILVQDNLPVEYVEKIKKQYEGLNLVDEVSQLKNITEICVCLDNYSALRQDSNFKEYQLTDIFDCSDKIDSYHNTEIEKFHNIHSGKRCFIVATGPSLRIEDLNLLKEKNEICISMNEIFHIFDKTKWKPHYYLMDDCRELVKNKDLIDTWEEIKAKFVGDTSELFWDMPHESNVYCYHKHYEYYHDRLPKFSSDFSKRSYTGATVTYTCIQLAAYMGFHEIYLLGVDFSYGDAESCQEYLHFFKEEKSALAKGFVKQVKSAYTMAEKHAKESGIRIYNATRGGKLEIFERVNFDTLF